MESHATERDGLGRRPYDQDCLAHRALTDTLQTTVDKSSGRWSAMLWFLGVIGVVLMTGLTVLITKTTAIQTSLNKNDIVNMQHAERIETLRKDVEEIKSRNRYIDQQGNMKTLMDKCLATEHYKFCNQTFFKKIGEYHAQSHLQTYRTCRIFSYQY